MLHLISQSPIDYAVLSRLGVDDEVIFLEDATLRLLQTSADNDRLTQLLNSHQLYVLGDALAVRGIATEELVQGICVLNYAQFVALTVKHPVIQSWC